MVAGDIGHEAQRRDWPGTNHGGFGPISMPFCPGGGCCGGDVGVVGDHGGFGAAGRGAGGRGGQGGCGRAGVFGIGCGTTGRWVSGWGRSLMRGITHAPLRRRYGPEDHTCMTRAPFPYRTVTCSGSAAQVLCHGHTNSGQDRTVWPAGSAGGKARGFGSAAPRARLLCVSSTVFFLIYYIVGTPPKVPNRSDFKG
jgi:hypothetical protein